MDDLARARLVRLLGLAIRDAEQRGSPYVGAFRQAAQELACPDLGGPGACRGCGGQLTGRQRAWCSEACRRRHRP
jgi:hypothetical protein